MFMKTYIKLLTISCCLVWLMSAVTSCTKDDAPQDLSVQLDLPEAIHLDYGAETTITIPAVASGEQNLTFQIRFDETENVPVGAGSLHDKLIQAVRLDTKKGQIHINSRAVYPNGVQSVTTGVTLPEDYRVTVVALMDNGTTVGKETISLTVAPRSVQVQGLQNNGEIPYAYALYGDVAPTFTLGSPDIATEGLEWHLSAQNEGQPVAVIEENTIVFNSTAGDPKKEAEVSYDLTPALLKDGFPVASTTFRVIFIPQIKFFYGSYYPEYNLTILLNLIHIGLSNSYTSAAPVLYPETYRSAFSIVSIEKDGRPYDNKDEIFRINAGTGSVTVRQNNTLEAGRYKIIVKAHTTTGLEFVTDLTLAMENG